MHNHGYDNSHSTKEQSLRILNKMHVGSSWLDWSLRVLALYVDHEARQLQAMEDVKLPFQVMRRGILEQFNLPIGCSI